MRAALNQWLSSSFGPALLDAISLIGEVRPSGGDL